MQDVNGLLLLSFDTWLIARLRCQLLLTIHSQTYVVNMLTYLDDTHRCGCYLQANFIVPSSREAVESNSAWNQELRGHLPQLFLQALEAFKAQPSTEHLGWVNRWLQCIPLPGEVP